MFEEIAYMWMSQEAINAYTEALKEQTEKRKQREAEEAKVIVNEEHAQNFERGFKC